jgi:phage replication O-like protein O
MIDKEVNPQLEDGYTSIANELLEAKMKINLSPYESRLFDCIMRKTYGYHKKADNISLSQFEKYTNIPRVNICRNLIKLNQRKIITKENNHSRIPIYGINKHYDKWVDSVHTDTISTDTISTDTISTDTISTDSVQSGNEVVSAQTLPIVRGDSVRTDTHKRNIKETITKERGNGENTLNIITIFKETFNREPINHEITDLIDLLKEYPEEIIIEAFKEATGKAYSLRFVEKILETKLQAINDKKIEKPLPKLFADKVRTNQSESVGDTLGSWFK